MSAEDEPLQATHLSPGQGLCLRGSNGRADTDIRRRHQQRTREEDERDAAEGKREAEKEKQ